MAVSKSLFAGVIAAGLLVTANPGRVPDTPRVFVPLTPVASPGIVAAVETKTQVADAPPFKPESAVRPTPPPVSVASAGAPPSEIPPSTPAAPKPAPKAGTESSGRQANSVEKLLGSAELGDRSAQRDLGVAYFEGVEILRDYTKSAEWFSRAVEQGDTVAAYNLAQLYRRGLGVRKNPKKAAGLYRLAADKGFAAAQFNLGLMYYEGLGLNRNLKQSLYWIDLAAAKGDKGAVALRQEIDRYFAK